MAVAELLHLKPGRQRLPLFDQEKKKTFGETVNEPGNKWVQERM